MKKARKIICRFLAFAKAQGLIFSLKEKNHTHTHHQTQFGLPVAITSTCVPAQDTERVGMAAAGLQGGRC